MPTTTNEANRFNFAAPVATIAPAGEGASKGLRTFSGIAYTGDAITSHHYWRSVVFDLSSITIAPKVPALIDHAASKRAGFVDGFSIDPAAGLTVSKRSLDVVKRNRGSMQATNGTLMPPPSITLRCIEATHYMRLRRYLRPASLLKPPAGQSMN